MEIIDYALFKKLPREKQYEIFRKLRAEYPDVKIREFWGMKVPAFAMLVKRISAFAEVNGLDSISRKQQSKRGPSKPPKEEKPQTSPSSLPWEDDEDDEDDNDVQEPKWVDAIEVDYKVIEEPKAQPPAPIQQEPTFLSFPPVTGTVAQMRKRLEGILLMMEGENEDTVFRLNITVDKL